MYWKDKKPEKRDNYEAEGEKCIVSLKVKSKRSWKLKYEGKINKHSIEGETTALSDRGNGTLWYLDNHITNWQSKNSIRGKIVWE